MRNTSGLRRTAGPGRPKGSHDKIPRGFKSSYARVFEEIASEDPELIKNAILRGLRGRPREAYPYLALGAAYVDGKPADTLHVKSQTGAPCVVVLSPNVAKPE